MLEAYIRKQLETRDILLMTHIVIGYPSFEASYEIIEQMVTAGVDLMELQIPFSEPIADGPVILKANQSALENGSTVQRCFDFAQKVSQDFPIPFLFMSYANIFYKYGMKAFADKMKTIGLTGAIVPDLPPEEGSDYLSAMSANELDPIFIFSPETSEERLSFIASHASGFIYCLSLSSVPMKHRC